MSNALIFEPNSYHYATIPSYVHYLQTIGYRVTLLVNRSFSSLEYLGSLSDGVRIILFDRWDHEEAISTLFSDEYDLIWVTTLDYKTKPPCIFEILRKGYPCPRDGLFGTVHSLQLARRYECDFDRFALVGTLSNYSAIENYTTHISLSYYDHRTNDIPKVDNKELRRFLSVGVSTSLAPVMSSSSVSRSRTASVTVCGRGMTRAKMIKEHGKDIARRMAKGKEPKRLVSSNPIALVKALVKFDFLGEIDFQRLCTEVKNADYLLACFEGKNREVFSTGCTSGTTILSLAYAKPMIVNEAVAESWGFDGRTCITFRGDFDEAMETALTMGSDDYNSLQGRILRERERREESTLKAIASAISDWHLGSRCNRD